MSRISILLIFIQFFFFVSAQEWRTDTLKYSYKTRGVLDSLDVHARAFSMPFFYYNFSDFPNENLLFDQNQNFYFPNQIAKNPKIIFTALPHIGFGYTFGQQGTQLLTANYQQSISKNLLLNANINQTQSNGFQRNSAFNLLNYRFLIHYTFKNIENVTSLSNSVETTQWSGGLLNDSLISQLPQNLISVNKENANSRKVFSSITSHSKVRFFKASKFKLGADIVLTYDRLKRTYNEEGDLFNQYAIINIDSLKTTDSIYLDKFNSAIGFYYSKGKFNLFSHLNTSYWKSKTMGRYIDTIEVNLDYHLSYSFHNVRLISKGNYGLIGNFNSYLIENELSLKRRITTFILFSQLDRFPPSPFIRDFRGNNLDYTLVNFNVQKNEKIGGQISFNKSIFSSTLKGEYRRSSDGYYFNSYEWLAQQVEVINSVILNYNFQINTSRIIAQMNYVFTKLPDGLNFLPQHQITARMAYKMGLFKDGRLKSTIGLDFLNLSAHKRLQYSPILGAFSLAGLLQQPILPGYYTFGAFANFNVNQFRFFIRIDNLPYFWVNKETEIINEFLYPSMQLKLGVTWDFWN